MHFLLKVSRPNANLIQAVYAEILEHGVVHKGNFGNANFEQEFNHRSRLVDYVVFMVS